MTQRFYFSSLLFILAILSSWLLWRYVLDYSWETPASPHNPDAFVNNLEVKVMDEEGYPQYQMTSPHLLHYSEGDKTTFVTPHGILYEKNAPPWTIDALSGEALNGPDKIILTGSVTMAQVKSAHNPMTTIHTDKAVIYPKQHVVTTDEFISATQPLAQAEGVGMYLDLKQRTLDLLSQVRGMYVPAKK